MTGISFVMVLRIALRPAHLFQLVLDRRQAALVSILSASQLGSSTSASTRASWSMGGAHALTL